MLANVDQRHRAQCDQLRRRRHARLSCDRHACARDAGRLGLRRRRRRRTKRCCRRRREATSRSTSPRLKRGATREIANNEPFLDIERQPAGAAGADDGGVEARRGDRNARRRRATDPVERDCRSTAGSSITGAARCSCPNVKLDALLKVLQEPQSDKHKQEDVLSSRVVSRDGDSQKVFLRLRRTKFVTVVYDTEYDVDYKRLSPDRALSNSISTKVVEIENAGTPRERALPEGNDHGYMWRLNSYWRYKQIDGGVLVEIESLTLSRDLPAIIGPLIRPIVNSTAQGIDDADAGVGPAPASCSADEPRSSLDWCHEDRPGRPRAEGARGVRPVARATRSFTPSRSTTGSGSAASPTSPR